MNKVRFLFLPFLGGILFALGFPRKDLPALFLLPSLGVAFFFYALGLWDKTVNVSKPSKLLTYFLFSSGFTLSGYYWIPYTIQEFGNIPAPFNYFLGLTFTLIVCPFLLVYTLGSTFLEKPLEKIWSYFKQGKIFFLAVLLTLIEYFIPQQFPAHHGHYWFALMPYLSLAPWLGLPAYSFISYLLSFWLVDVFNKKKISFLVPSCFLLFLILNLASPLKWQGKDSLVVRVVQANIGNFLKLQSESGDYRSILQVIGYYKEQSLAGGEKPLDLIIWPETAYPYMLDSQVLAQFPQLIPSVFQEIMKSKDTSLFVGGYDRNKENRYGWDFNTGFYFSKEGQVQAYHKQKLIPFGETLPFGPLNAFLSRYITNISYFSSGQSFPLFELGNYNFASVICYEILFSEFLRKNLNQLQEAPYFLINLTNDSWYGDTAEPLQHKFLAHWKGVEFQIPIVRSTNTGITSVLYPDGKESQQLGVGSRGFLDLSLRLQKRQESFFQRFGIYSLLLIWLLVGLFIKLKKRSPASTNHGSE